MSIFLCALLIIECYLQINHKRTGPADSVSLTLAGIFFERIRYGLFCNVTGGNPTPTVNWNINSTRVATGVNPYIYAAKREEDGLEISCEAANVQGTVLAEAQTLEVYCE